jgi:hypothetical protein
MGVAETSSDYHFNNNYGGLGGGFLGFRSRNSNSNNTALASPSTVAASYQQQQQQSHQSFDHDEALSVASVVTSNNFWSTAKENQQQSKKKKKNTNAMSLSLSIASDLSLSSSNAVDDDDFCLENDTIVLDNDDENDDDDVFASSGNDEFVIQCQRGEMLFVANPQAKTIKARCRHFRLLLTTGRGDQVIVSSSTSATPPPQQQAQHQHHPSEDHRILQKETWSIGTARHVIELLTEGTTWIQQDRRHFQKLAKACEEIDVKLCLGSLINYHDILDQDSTFRFFDLISLDNYQFKFQAIVTSWQWMQLLRQGILLLPNAKVLMITVAPPKGGGSIFFSSSSGTTTNTTKSLPNRQRRLAKCDTLHSEFCVYSTHGSKINALLTILNLLAQCGDDLTSDDANINNKNNSAAVDATATSNTTTTLAETKKRQQRGINKNKGRATTTTPSEKFQIVYQTCIGSIQTEDWNMLWRLTSASYTLSTPKERQYLPKMKELPLIIPSNKPSNAVVVVPAGTETMGKTSLSRRTSNAVVTKDDDREGDNRTTNREEPSPSIALAAVVTAPAAATSEHNDNNSTNVPSSQRLRHDTKPTRTLPIVSTTPITMDQNQQCFRYQFRTITGTSCMVLRHLFDPLNTNHDHNNDHSNNLLVIDSTRLPACLLVINPSPDTLGRFLNAAAYAASFQQNNNNNHDRTTATTATVGWDLVVTSSSCKQPKTVIFYISSTTCEIKYALEYLSDYNSSAIIVNGSTCNNNNTDNNNKKSKQKKTLVPVDFRLQQYMSLSSSSDRNAKNG